MTLLIVRVSKGLRKQEKCAKRVVTTKLRMAISCFLGLMFKDLASIAFAMFIANTVKKLKVK
jgi:hypothetical protein